MRSITLSDEEVAHIAALRTLPRGRQEVIFDLVLEMAAPEVVEPAATNPNHSVVSIRSRD